MFLKYISDLMQYNMSMSMSHLQFATVFVFGPQTANNDGRVSAQPLKIARRMSCRLTFARHFGLTIFAR